jgi:hypothetical protein
VSALALYPLLLGDAWSALPEPVRRCHDAAPSLLATGRFKVTRGSSWFARVSAWLGGMPHAGDDVPTRLEVRSYDDHQIWSRDFGGFAMLTRQSMLADGRMAERRGPVELLFRVTSEDGAVVYRPAGMRLRIGPIAIPIPGWFALRVEARAWCEPDDLRMHVLVSVRSSLGGTIATYGGPLTPG